MGIIKDCLSQTRKPKGILGKLMVRGMNLGHAKIADWGMEQLKIEAPEKIIDIGSGGGRNTAELLKKYPGATVTAIDYSAVSVEQTAAYNRKSILEGRCDVQQGDVASMDFADSSFDLATAFETVYFWPGPGKCFAEVLRVLKPGGLFLIVNESDGRDAAGRKFEKIIDGMKLYTAEEIEEILRDAGFVMVQTIHHGREPWISVLAKK